MIAVSSLAVQVEPGCQMFMVNAELKVAFLGMAVNDFEVFCEKKSLICGLRYECMTINWGFLYMRGPGLQPC